MVVVRHDVDDRGRDLQFRRLCLRRCNPRHHPRRPVRRHRRNPVCYLSQRTTQLCGQGWLLHVHRWVGRHCHERAQAIIRCNDPAVQEVHDRSWVLDLRGDCHRWMRLRRAVGGTSIWQEEHDGVLDHLQLDRRVECSGDARVGCCDRHTGWWDAAVQPVVSVCVVGVCYRDAGHRDHLSQCGFYSPQRS